MFAFSFKQFIDIAILPGFKTRLEDLFASGFKNIAYFIALVFQGVGLLPNNHQYVNAHNIGRFGIRHVIAEAANNLILDIKNLDQILLFLCVLIGIALIAIQIILFGLTFLIHPVFAAMPSTFSGFFITPTDTQDTDIAGILLDLVFGVPDMFHSCVSEGTICTDASGRNIEARLGPYANDSIFAGMSFPFPIHNALHQMFQMYSYGLLIIAAMITLYFIVTVIAETAQSGTPFGKRFNKVWAPLRLVVAIGLLFPIGEQGLNGSQYAVLYAAKFGSGFATNGWRLFNDSLTGEGYFGNGQKLASIPNVPQVNALVQFFYIARACKYSQEAAYPSREEIKMYTVRGAGATNNPPNFLEITNGTSYDEMLTAAGENSVILIRFGRHNPEAYKVERGNVESTCGDVTLRLNDSRPASEADPGPLVMQKYYWMMLKELWFTTYSGAFPEDPLSSYTENYPRNLMQKYGPWDEDFDAIEPPAEFKRAVINFYENDIKKAIEDPSSSSRLSSALGSTGAYEAITTSGSYAVQSVLKEKGWAGAAIWYNKVAELNGALITSVLNIPLPSKYPKIMEEVQSEKRRKEENVPLTKRFEPKIGKAPFTTGDRQITAEILWKSFQYWQNGTTPFTPEGNAIVDTIRALFGTEGLYNMRKNANVHPLAQLVGVGRSLVEAAIRNLTVSVIGGAASALISTFVDQTSGKLISTFTTFLVTFAMIGLTAGFVLFYMVPFLPFIYFFFAVGGWIKGIFEAMVGAPLWALAHIRIDANGLPGQQAVSGYFLIFEIFLRPILMVFGLLASVTTFSALVSILNNTFDLMTSNVGGFDHSVADGGTTFSGEALPSSLGDLQNVIDEFFFTVIYAIIVYMMGMSSFKLIDLIPNNILRWMGQSVSTFNDQREDIAQAMISKATVGAQQTSGALGKGIKSIAGGGG